METKLRWYERITLILVTICLCCRYGLKGADKIVTDAFNEAEKEYELLKVLSGGVDYHRKILEMEKRRLRANRR